MRQLTHGSLFTGILGFEQGMGDYFAPSWCAEVDKFCNKIIALRAPGVPNLGDVTAIQHPEPVDVVSFGSPCQDLSVAGRRAGLDGARSGLFFEAARIINQCRPSFAIWENVPGAFSSDAGRDLWMVLYTLRELGANDVAWRVFDSQYAGVPQQRRRIYLVADFRGRRAGEILFDPEGCGGHPSPFGAEGEGPARTLTRGSSRAGVNPPGRHLEDDYNLVARAVGRHANADRGDDVGSGLVVASAMTSKWAKGSGGPAGDEIQNLVPVVANRRGGFGWSQREDGLSPTLQTQGGSHQGAPDVTPYVIQDAREGVDSKGQNGVGARRSDTAYTLDTLATQAVAFEPRHFTRGKAPLTAQAGADGRGDSAQYAVFVQNSRSEVREMERHGALAAANLGDTAQQVHYMRAGSTIRRFTPLECERLQGFPDGWTCLCMPIEAWAADPGAAMFACRCPDGPRYRALGNAVTANVPRWLASRLAGCL